MRLFWIVTAALMQACCAPPKPTTGEELIGRTVLVELTEKLGNQPVAHQEVAGRIVRVVRDEVEIMPLEDSPLSPAFFQRIELLRPSAQPRQHGAQGADYRTSVSVAVPPVLTPGFVSNEEINAAKLRERSKR